MEDLNTTEHTDVLIIFLVSLEWQRKKVGVENAKFMISNSAPQHGQVHPNITQTSALTAWEAEHKHQILSHWKREWSLQEILLYVDKFYLREHKRTLKVQTWWISSEPYPRQFPLPSQSSLLLWARHLLGESLGNGAGVGDWPLLLRGQLLIHSEGVIIHHKGHQQGQEPGDQLGFLGGREENKAIISHLMPPNGPGVLWQNVCLQTSSSSQNSWIICFHLFH